MCIPEETKDFLRDLSQQQAKETMKKQLTLGWKMIDRCDGCSGHIWQHFHEVAESGSISFPICETLNQSTRCKTSSMVFQGERTTQFGSKTLWARANGENAGLG
jgi:hypothetical protein